MDSSKPEEEEEVFFDFSPILRMYKDGRVERPLGTITIPPSIDLNTGVSSKDVVVVPETGVSVRLYLPKITEAHQEKLPILVYFHGGAFVIGSAVSPLYHSYVNSVVAEAKVVGVSVDYRLAPEHPLPICYDDSWAAFQWLASQSNGEGSESWLNDHADFRRVFLGGDSAGANISHNMAMRAQDKPLLPGIRLIGTILIHPFFTGVDAIGCELNDLQSKARVEKSWFFVCPTTSGCDDPLANPTTDPNLSKLGCERVLVCVAEKDQFRDRGWLYEETLGKSDWGGEVQFFEAKGEDHCFHLFKPTCDDAVNMMKLVTSFINRDDQCSKTRRFDSEISRADSTPLKTG